MDETKIRDELVEKRKGIKDFDGLVLFLEDIKDNYSIGYGRGPIAMAQASLSVACYLANEFSITGFQAGFVMWDFIRGWSYESNKSGLKILDYDKMLYPQYSDEFEKTISTDAWKSLQEQAVIYLKDNAGANEDIIAHWRSIVDGVVPFGYTVKGD